MTIKAVSLNKTKKYFTQGKKKRKKDYASSPSLPFRILFCNLEKVKENLHSFIIFVFS